jgi:hypothetical protein
LHACLEGDMSLKGGLLKEPSIQAIKGWSFVVKDETVSLVWACGCHDLDSFFKKNGIANLWFLI